MKTDNVLKKCYLTSLSHVTANWLVSTLVFFLFTYLFRYLFIYYCICSKGVRK